MDLSLNDKQEILKKSARDFLKKEYPKSLVRQVDDSSSGYATGLWQKMAQLGWLGLTFPPKYGGTGGDFLDMAVLYIEMGRAALVSPHLSTVMICGHLILEYGNEQQKLEFLPNVIRGNVIIAPAIIEAAATWDIGAVTTRAIADRDGYIINGTKLFVNWGHIADYLLCVAKIQTGDAEEDGTGLFIINAKYPGIFSTPLKTTGLTRQSEVVFSNVRVTDSTCLAKIRNSDKSLLEALQPAIVMQCAEMVGGAEMVLEMSLEYAKNRVQFGHPIGSFQAIQHKCSDMAIDVDGAKLITLASAWKLSHGINCIKEVSMAKAQTNAAYKHVTWEGHQIHAGVAFLKDYDLQLYSRSALDSEFNLGDTEFHQRIIAQQMGLVRVKT